jgi:hypothetical protein
MIWKYMRSHLPFKCRADIIWCQTLYYTSMCQLKWWRCCHLLCPIQIVLALQRFRPQNFAHSNTYKSIPSAWHIIQTQTCSPKIPYVLMKMETNVMSPSQFTLCSTLACISYTILPFNIFVVYALLIMGVRRKIPSNSDGVIKIALGSLLHWKQKLIQQNLEIMDCKIVISARNLIHLIKCGYCPEGKIQDSWGSKVSFSFVIYSDIKAWHIHC